MLDENLSMEDGMEKDRLRNRVQVVLFALVLMMPSLGYLAGVNDEQLLAENRRLADRPSWPTNAEEVQAYPAAFERHFDDHFGFRSFLVGRDKRLEWLGARTQVEIQIGLDGWLFQGFEEDLADRACVEPTDSVLADWVRLQKNRQERLDQMGIEYGWILAPNKHTVHSEYLPEEVRSKVQGCRTERLAGTFRKEALPLIDLRPVLAAKKTNRILYHQTDTHWNQLGAAFGVQEIIDRIRFEFPAVPRFSLGDYEVVVEEDSFEGNLAARLRVYGETYSENFLRLERRQGEGAARLGDAVAPIDLRVHSREDLVVEFATGHADLPTAIVFHDSFGFAAMEMLAEHFESVQFVNFRGLLDYELIEEERPDLVLSLIVELRLLESPAPDGAPPARALASSPPRR